ncbi:MAG: DUF58 domain-containing protein [Akkermansiaceae bacterium]
MSEIDREVLMGEVRDLEIKAKRLSRESFSGEYHTSFKGQGLDFEDYREYQHGDETRFIDWKVTARMNAPHIRTFREERELSVLLAVDVSGSGRYASGRLSKKQKAARLAAVLAFCAKYNGDKVGLLLFTDRTELYLPPAKGSKHVLRIIREILGFEPEGKGTSIAGACDFINRTLRRKSLVFLLSDFMDHDFEKKLGALGKQHETIAMRVYDPVEEELPMVGKVNLTDPETGWQTMVNTNNANVRMGYSKLNRRRLEGLQKTFNRYKIASMETATDEDFLPALHRLFKRIHK